MWENVARGNTPGRIRRGGFVMLSTSARIRSTPVYLGRHRVSLVA